MTVDRLVDEVPVYELNLFFLSADTTSSICWYIFPRLSNLNLNYRILSIAELSVVTLTIFVNSIKMKIINLYLI
jgi:hypothetical protein